MRVVGFTGTRGGMTDMQRLVVSELLDTLVSNHGIGVAVHGDCIGADADFNDIAREKGLIIETRPANMPNMRANCLSDLTHDPEPPLDRNVKIVQSADVMVATPAEHEEQRRSGTWFTIRRAKDHFKSTYIVYPDGSLG